MPIAPNAVKTAKARLCPTSPISRGDHQQPIKNPTKWADPSKPTCPELNPEFNPVRASSGPIPPDENCSSSTDKIKAAKEMITRIA